MNKGLISSLSMLVLVYVMVVGNANPKFSKSTDYSVESMPGQVDVISVDKAGNSIGTPRSDMDIAPGPSFDSYGLQGAWKSTF